jgi:hypothetical protein
VLGIKKDSCRSLMKKESVFYPTSLAHRALCGKGADKKRGAENGLPFVCLSIPVQKPLAF